MHASRSFGFALSKYTFEKALRQWCCCCYVSATIIRGRGAVLSARCLIAKVESSRGGENRKKNDTKNEEEEFVECRGELERYQKLNDKGLTKMSMMFLTIYMYVCILIDFTGSTIFL